jgi:hypothetical protein
MTSNALFFMIFSLPHDGGIGILSDMPSATDRRQNLTLWSALAVRQNRRLE